jgi:phosphoribosylformimino-5-aminoimidazole carboxamide ribonucleotide (ProFAR) isomerase
MTSSFLIPSIDLVAGEVATWADGRVVPTPEVDPLALADRTAHLGLLHLVDLDAILGRAAAGAPGAPNTRVMRAICRRYSCRIAGGVRTPEDVLARIELGAHQVILASALFGAAGLDRDFLARLGQRVPREQLVFALDGREGELLRSGWQGTTGLAVEDVIDELAPQCSGFVLTAVEREGTALGPDLAAAGRLRARTRLPLAVAGGIATWPQVESLAAIDAQAVVSAVKAEALCAERVR